VKCGGLDSASSLVQAVRRHEIDGKGVIYPQAEHSLFDVEKWDLEKERNLLDES